MRENFFAILRAADQLLEGASPSLRKRIENLKAEALDTYAVGLGAVPEREGITVENRSALALPSDTAYAALPRPAPPSDVMHALSGPAALVGVADEAELLAATPRRTSQR